jgi:transcriptional regulator with XRE-family HTH domain
MKIVVLDENIFVGRNVGMLTPAQCRSARGWLNWTQAELATTANVGLSTVRDFESESRTPIQNNLAALRAALEGGGGAAFLKATDNLKPEGHRRKGPQKQRADGARGHAKPKGSQ